MAAYRGTLQGHRGQASRLGTKKSGIEVTANTWETQVVVRYYHHFASETSRVSIIAQAYGGGKSRVLYDGPEADLLVNAAAEG